MFCVPSVSSPISPSRHCVLQFPPASPAGLAAFAPPSSLPPSSGRFGGAATATAAAAAAAAAAVPAAAPAAPAPPAVYETWVG